MKYFFSFLLLLLMASSCMDMDQVSQDLCIPVVCGEIQNDQANLALFNDSGVDFDALYYDIGGVQDTVGFFPLKQYTCWINLDTLNTEYFFATGVSDNITFRSDTIWMHEEAKTFTSGVFVLEIYKASEENKLDIELVEDYSGECKDL